MAIKKNIKLTSGSGWTGNTPVAALFRWQLSLESIYMLRKICTKVGVQTARSKKECIDRIMASDAVESGRVFINYEFIFK